MRSANSSAKRVSLRRRTNTACTIAALRKLLCKTSQFEAGGSRCCRPPADTANSSAKRVSLRRRHKVCVHGRADRKLLCKTSQFEAVIDRACFIRFIEANSSAKRVSLRRWKTDRSIAEMLRQTPLQNESV